MSTQAGQNVGAINRSVATNRMLTSAQEKVQQASRPTFGEVIVGSTANMVSQGAGRAIGASLFADEPNTGDKSKA